MGERLWKRATFSQNLSEPYFTGNMAKPLRRVRVAKAVTAGQPSSTIARAPNKERNSRSRLGVWGFAPSTMRPGTFSDLAPL
jgi:hypothetical protein